MNLLADAEWLIRLERELRKEPGPAIRTLAENRVYINFIASCEFLTAGATPRRLKLLGKFRKTQNIGFLLAAKAAKLREDHAKRGKTLGTPDAITAATAIAYNLRLVTADKDFSGIPGLDWASYKD